MQTFRDRLSKGRIVDYWKDSFELCAKVVIAVGQTSTLFPGAGWIRGDQAIDPKILQELELLRIENDSLKQRIGEDALGETQFPAQFAGPDETFNFTLESSSRPPSPSVKASWTFGKIFAVISEEILVEKSEGTIGHALAQNYLEIVQREIPNKDNYQVNNRDLRTLRFHFDALGLIQAVGRSESLGQFGLKHDYVAWMITEKGRKYISGLWAVKRSNS